MKLIPRRRRDQLMAAQAEADQALKQSVDGLHAEVLQLGVVSGRTAETRRLAQRFLHWQHRNHFAENMARALGEARAR